MRPACLALLLVACGSGEETPRPPVEVEAEPHALEAELSTPAAP